MAFGKYTLEEVKIKQALKLTKVKEKKQKAVSIGVKTKKSLKAPKSDKLPPLGTLQKKADSYLTPICKKISPNCESCGQITQVGHHWIEKSRSAFLRYDMRNLIALCNSCHAKIHNRFGNSVVGGYDVADRIISQRGKEWKDQLDIDQRKTIKVDRDHYMTNIERLKNLLDC